MYEVIFARVWISDLCSTTQAAGEHPDKPKQIAGGQTERFNALYADAMHRCVCDIAHLPREYSQGYAQDMSPAARSALFTSLPQSVIASSAQKLGMLGEGSVRELVGEAVQQEPARKCLISFCALSFDFGGLWDKCREMER